jgi:hypothetical protein
MKPKYDTTPYTAESFPKHLTFGMRCEVEFEAIQEINSSGRSSWCNHQHPEIRQLEQDGWIVRHEKEADGIGRYRYTVNPEKIA